MTTWWRSGPVAATPWLQPERLLQHTELGARELVHEGLTIASGIDIYTNDRITIEELAE